MQPYQSRHVFNSQQPRAPLSFFLATHWSPCLHWDQYWSHIACQACSSQFSMAEAQDPRPGAGVLCAAAMLSTAGLVLSEKMDVLQLTFYTAPVSFAMLLPFYLFREVNLPPIPLSSPCTQPASSFCSLNCQQPSLRIVLWVKPVLAGKESSICALN